MAFMRSKSDEAKFCGMRPLLSENVMCFDIEEPEALFDHWLSGVGVGSWIYRTHIRVYRRFVINF